MLSALNRPRKSPSGQLWKYDKLAPSTLHMLGKEDNLVNDISHFNSDAIVTNKSEAADVQIEDPTYSGVLSMELDSRHYQPEHKNALADHGNSMTALMKPNGDLGLFDLSAVVAQSPAPSDCATEKTRSTPVPDKSASHDAAQGTSSQPIQILGATPEGKEKPPSTDVSKDMDIAVPSTAMLRELESSTLPFCSYPEPLNVDKKEVAINVESQVTECAPVSQEATLELDPSDFNQLSATVIIAAEQEHINSTESKQPIVISSDLNSTIDLPSATLLCVDDRDKQVETAISQNQRNDVIQTQKDDLLPPEARIRLNYSSLDPSQPEDLDGTGVCIEDSPLVSKNQADVVSETGLKDGFKTPSIIRTHKPNAQQDNSRHGAEKTPRQPYSDTLDSDTMSITSDQPYSTRRIPLVSPQPLPDTQPILSLDPNLPHLNDDDEDVFELRQAITRRDSPSPQMSKPSTKQITDMLSSSVSSSPAQPKVNGPLVILSSQPMERDAVVKSFDESPPLMTSMNETDRADKLPEIKSALKSQSPAPDRSDPTQKASCINQDSNIVINDAMNETIDIEMEEMKLPDPIPAHLKPCESKHQALGVTEELIGDQKVEVVAVETVAMRGLPRPASKEIIADSQEVDSHKSASQPRLTPHTLLPDGDKNETKNVFAIVEETMSPVLESDIIDDTIPVDTDMELPPSIDQLIAPESPKRSSGLATAPELPEEQKQLPVDIALVQDTDQTKPKQVRNGQLRTKKTRKSRGRKFDPEPKTSEMCEPPENELLEKKSTVSRKSCDQCQEMSTSCWREGPHGPETLCDRCGRAYALKKNYAPIVVRAPAETMIKETQEEPHSNSDGPRQKESTTRSVTEPRAHSSPVPHSPSPSVPGVRRRKLRVTSPKSAYFSSSSSSEPDDSSDEDFTVSKSKGKSSRLSLPPVTSADNDVHTKTEVQPFVNQDPRATGAGDASEVEEVVSKKRRKSTKSNAGGRATKKARSTLMSSSSVSPLKGIGMAKGKSMAIVAASVSRNITPSGNHKPQSRLELFDFNEPSPVKSQNLVPILHQQTTPTVVAKNVPVKETSSSNPSGFQEGEFVWAWWESHFYTAMIISHCSKKNLYRIGYLSDGQEEEQPKEELQKVQIRVGDQYLDWTSQGMTEIEVVQVFPTHVIAKPRQQQARPSKSKSSSSKQSISTGLRMVPLGRLAADQKMMKANNGRLFGIFGFCLTLSDQLEPNEEQVTIEAQWLNKAFVWDKIEEAGGTIYKDLTECFHHDRSRKDIPENLILISTRPSKTRKYLMALGFGIPIVSSMWIKACLEANDLVDMSLYRLPNGVSYLTANQSIAPAVPDGIFSGLVIYVSESDAQKRQDWIDIIAAGGATVIQKSNFSASSNCDYVVCFTQPSTDTIRQIIARTDAPIVSTQWVVQCLVHQSILNYRLFETFSSWI